MRLPLFLLLTALAPLCAGVAHAQTRHQPADGSLIYEVPAGFEVIVAPTLEPGQAAFSVMRTTSGARTSVGVCVMGGKTLSGAPNLPAWNNIIAGHRADTESKARARVKAPATFVRVGGYRDLKFAEGDGYAFWYQQRTPSGEETQFGMAALIRPQVILTGSCGGNQGQTFTQAEIEQIIRLISSTRRP